MEAITPDSLTPFHYIEAKYEVQTNKSWQIQEAPINDILSVKIIDMHDLCVLVVVAILM